MQLPQHQMLQSRCPKNFMASIQTCHLKRIKRNPRINQTEAIVKLTPGLNSSMDAGAKNSAANDTTAGSTEKLNGNVTTNEVDQSKIRGDKTETVIKLNTSPDNSSETLGTSGNSSTTETVTKSGRRLLENDGSKESADGYLDNKDNSEGVRMATVQNDGVLEAEADSSFDLLRDTDELGDEYNYDYDDYVDEKMWGDEVWVEGQHQNSEDYVNIDAHILCTPVRKSKN